MNWGRNGIKGRRGAAVGEGLAPNGGPVGTAWIPSHQANLPWGEKAKKKNTQKTIRFGKEDENALLGFGVQGLQLSALLQASSTQNLLGTFGHPQTSPIFSQAREIREQSVFSEDVGALSFGTQLPLRAIFNVIIPRTSSPP